MGERAILPNRGTARVIVSAVLIISHILFDLLDIFRQRRGFVWLCLIFSGEVGCDREWTLETDCRDGSLLSPVSAHLAMWVYASDNLYFPE